MFGRAKNVRADKNDKNRNPAPVQQPQRLAVFPAAAAPEPEPAESISCISAGVTIVGKIAGEGTIKIFGRVEGELKASTVVIAAGAQVVGDVVADELTIGGRVKGTVHANRVKLDGTAIVEGDIFHRSLSIEEDARFEGSSRREENDLDNPSSVDVSRLQAQAQTAPQTQSPIVATDGNHKLNGQPSHEAHAHPATA
jgi:cytoskeletal protein CcmA (bactofilin family)